MAGYLNQNGNSIGSLLRFIQEQKSQSPMVPPATEASSPIRGVIQEPLKGPEDTGTQKVVSIRPEGVTGIPKSAPVSQSMAGGVSPAGIGPGRSAESNIAGARFGWAGIGGGGPLNVPIGVVAANEPGTGLGIPSATKSVGEVVKTPSIPSIGTKITPAQTTKGTTVQQVNRTYNPAGIETTMADTQARIAAGDRSLAETQARTAQLESELAETERQLALLENPTYNPNNPSDVAMARQLGQQLSNTNRPSPTPTPAPSQGGRGGQSVYSKGATPTKTASGFTSGFSGGSVAGKSSGGGGGGSSWTAPQQQAPQQSIQQKIATIVKKSPFSWLFGR